MTSGGGTTSGGDQAKTGTIDSGSDEREPPAPIQLDGGSERSRATTRRVRQGAAWIHAALVVVVVAAVFVQVYLIGAYLFGAGPGALAAHKSAGYITHSVELAIPIVALVAWLPRTDIALSITLAAVGTAQVSLADAHRWIGGLHPLGALVVLTIAALLARRSPVRGPKRPRSRGSSRAATGRGTT